MGFGINSPLEGGHGDVGIYTTKDKRQLTKVIYEQI